MIKLKNKLLTGHEICTFTIIENFFIKDRLQRRLIPRGPPGGPGAEAAKAPPIGPPGPPGAEKAQEPFDN